MSLAILRIPTSTTDDSGDVAQALDIARVLLEKGDPEGALRWVRRAVEAADQAGDTVRAFGLADAANDLAAALGAQKGSATGPTMTQPLSSAASSGRWPALPSDAPVVHPQSSTAGTTASPFVWALDGRTRVSVKTSVRDPALLLLRPLPEGQRPPPGTREGFLSLLPGDVERGNSNGSGAK